MIQGADCLIGCSRTLFMPWCAKEWCVCAVCARVCVLCACCMCCVCCLCFAPRRAQLHVDVTDIGVKDVERVGSPFLVPSL